jgi:hypothetical protein
MWKNSGNGNAMGVVNHLGQGYPKTLIGQLLLSKVGN